MKKTLSIVLICGLLITMGGVSVFAETVPDTNTFTSTTQIPSGDNTVRLIINGSVGNWTLVQADVEYDRAYSFTQAAITSWSYSATHSQTTGVENGVGHPVYGSGGTLSSSLTNRGNFIFARQFVVRIQLVNNSNHAVTLNNYYKLFSFDGTFNDSFFGFDHIINNHDIMVYPYSSNSFYCYFNELKNFYPSGSYVMEANSIQDCIITFTQYRLSGNANIPANNDTISVVVNSSGISSYTVSSQYDGLVTDMYTAQELMNLNNLDSNVQSILDAYTSNSQNAQNVTNNTQTNDQTLSNIGTNEDTWFTQNNQALQATGITNFNYTPTVMSGMSVISDQFNQLWLAIGDWNFVYTFSMMLGLVVLILRHNPQRKKSSSSGSGGGKSNATSS